MPSSALKNVYDNLIVRTSAVVASSSIAGSIKRVTGISTDWPGCSVCKLKQKHCSLLKYCPVFSGVTLKVAIPVVGSSLMVYSGLRFVHEAVAQGKPVAAINQGRMRSEDLLALKIEQDCGPLLQQLAQDLAQ